LKRRRHLTPAILSGLPQLSQKHYPGVLLREGIYSRIRHPRYVEVTLWVLGYALFANFLASYLVAALTPAVLYLIVFLEERELAQRFGKEWEEYAREVPRFVPRRRV
jgi:protein-S-isoprenylcysteine O-methyltransferase Ste14